MFHSDEKALTREALRVYRRYQVEIVETFSICPWAARARADSRVRETVITDTDPTSEEIIDAVEALAAVPTVDIGLLIFPRVTLGRQAFEHLVGRVREAYSARHPRGTAPMALAAFHPGAEANLESPARLVPFLRRSPDPTIQLVRMAVLDGVRKTSEHGTGFIDPTMLDVAAVLAAGPQEPPLHERVAQANVDMVERGGLARIEAVLDDIKRDRDESYARLMNRPAPSTTTTG